MSLRLVTPPASLPVTVEAAKEYLRVLHDDEDAVIEQLIGAATEHVEAYTGRAIMPQTWELVLDAFSDAILIPKGPVTAIEAISYFDPDEAEQTVSDTEYALDAASDPQWLVRAADASWPAVAGGVNNVIIRFAAGYETVPQPLKLAVLMLVGQWFDNRGAVNVGNIVNEMPNGIAALLVTYRSFY